MGKVSGKVQFYARDLTQLFGLQALPAGKVSPIELDLTQNREKTGGLWPTKPLPREGFGVGQSKTGHEKRDRRGILEPLIGGNWAVVGGA